MRKACSGSVILFSMQEHHDLVGRWVRRGRKAVVLEKGPLGEMIVIKEGRRTMPVAWVHTLPATFDGRARMNVQNAMAAAAAAHAAGAHLHDIRQGLRSFTTSFYQAPGRLNLLDLDGVKVIIDYAHNPHGLKSLGEFVEHMTADEGARSWSANLRLAVVATAGDRLHQGAPGRRGGRPVPRRGRRPRLHPAVPGNRAVAGRSDRSPRWVSPRSNACWRIGGEISRVSSRC